jgi:hypothetical protein
MKAIHLLLLSATLFISNTAAQPALTIYNQDFALVRDQIQIDLKQGITEVRYSGATSQLDPQSVILRDPTGQLSFQILEQSYRNDPADEALLLKMNEGNTIEFEVDAGEGRKTLVKGKIIRADHPSPIIEIDNRIRFELPGRPWFPTLGDSSILRPTLTWQIQSPTQASGSAELAYITNGLSWNADYNLLLPEQGNSLDLIGWVSVHNHSGKTFENAKIQLMAGDVRKIQPRLPMMAMARASAIMAEPEAMEDTVSQKSFDDYHLYTVARSITLRTEESKQVEFARATQIQAERFYVYSPDGNPFGGSSYMMGDEDYGDSSGSTKITSYIEFKNSKENNLGIPLPKGRLRLYRQDGSQTQFIGEAEMDHTPKDELLRFATGNAFDLVGSRKRIDFQRARNRNELTETFEINLRNRKEQATEIRVMENLNRFTNWEIKNNSLPFKKLNAQRIEFRVPLNADEEKTLQYSITYTW